MHRPERRRRGRAAVVLYQSRTPVATGSIAGTLGSVKSPLNETVSSPAGVSSFPSASFAFAIVRPPRTGRGVVVVRVATDREDVGHAEVEHERLAAGGVVKTSPEKPNRSRGR
jgi:hypothetical protein